MKKRIVIALGGNALGNNLEEQYLAVRNTAGPIVDLIEAGHQVVIAHGNGPQVGMIQNAMTALHKQNPEKYGECPLAVCGAMSQGYIGYDLQNALREVLLERGIQKPVTTLITQVEVDLADPAFQNPTKPIGSFMTKEEAEILQARGENVVEDAGRGYRRVVASPRPIGIVELESVKTLMDAGQIVITCGGGGIPVAKQENGKLMGVPAVIDKDFAAELLAELVDADMLIILTAVEKVAIRFRQPDEQWLSEMTIGEAEKHIAAGEFAPGSMLPKVQAAVRFAGSGKGRTALITLLEKAAEGISGQTGTRVVGE
ncbi:MAG: carbamate kinase [Ruminococcaceae bacterium]|nr:carbamate kinase [Oscillospiraceae bacterium]